MPNIAPTPSATPITGVFCRQFPTMSFEANRFGDLSLQVDELLSRIRGVENEIEYHVNFGDGSKVFNQKINYDQNVGYEDNLKHTYLESDIYTATVAVDNLTTLRRSCAEVDIFVSRDAPLKCSELHIQSNNAQGENSFIDLSQNEYTINTVSSIHSDQETIFGTTSIHLIEKSENYSLQIESSRTGFDFFHQNPRRNWTIQSWVNVDDVSDFNPIIGNVNTEADVGFNFGIKNKKINFQISNDKGTSNIVNIEYESDIKSKQWYHLAAIKEEDNVYLFIDGERKASQQTSLSNYVLKSASNDIRIGYQSTENETGNFVGFIQDLKISQSVDFDIQGFDKPSDFSSPECGDPPSFCPEFLLQSNDDNKASTFKDYGPNEYNILPGAGNPYHSNLKTIYGKSSIKF